MNPQNSPGLSVTTLLALRQESDAIRVITERLKVKEMGPADHIRTKHEVKAFVESGDLTAAEALLKNAQARRELNQGQSISEKMTQQRGPRMNQ
jgi:hypothetical protein